MSKSSQFPISPYDVSESVDITVQRIANSDTNKATFKGICITFTVKDKERTEKIPENVYFFESILPPKRSVQIGENTTSEVPIKKRYKDNISYELQQVTIQVNCIVDGSPKDHFVIDFTTKV
jgi:hypothetical protein